MRSANHKDQARLDIYGRGFWNQMEKAFDVRIYHPNAAYNRSRSLNQLHSIHEAEKKRTYNDRIIEVEHATFTPLVFTTSGDVPPECRKFHQRLAFLLFLKRKEPYTDTISFIRRKIRFCILCTTLVATSGYRRPKEHLSIHMKPLSEIDFFVAEQVRHR